MKKMANLTRGTDIEIPVTVTAQTQANVGEPSGLACHDKHVTWRITNNAPQEVAVTVHNFKTKCNGQTDWPFTSKDKSKKVKPGETKDLSLTVLHSELGKSGAWVYEYGLTVDAQTADPEIVIEWP